MSRVRRGSDAPERREEPVIVSVGVDIVEVARVQRLLEEEGDRFLGRVYTPAEQTYCLDKARSGEHLAARFAAKEAVMKGLGTGWSQGVKFSDVEVERKPTGEVTVALTGRALQVSESRGIQRIHLSLSHTPEQAVAFALAESTGPAERGSQSQ